MKNFYNSNAIFTSNMRPFMSYKILLIFTSEITMLNFFTDNNHRGHYNHHILSGGSPRFVFYHASFSQLAMAVGTVMVVLSVLTVAVVCFVLVCYRRKLSR